MARPLWSTTTISSAWFAHTQMLSSSSMARPSAPLMLLVKTSAVRVATGIFTIVSFPVLATNSTVWLRLNASPLAPKGGTPVVVSSGLCAQTVAAPPVGVVCQMIPWNESEM